MAPAAKAGRWGATLVACVCVLASGCGRKADPSTSSEVVAAMNRGVSEMGQYNYDGAVKAFESVLQTAPDLIDAKVNLAIARFNRAQKEHQDVEQARALLDEVLQKDPANSRAWYFKGIVLQHQGDAAAAVPCFERVVHQQPDDGVAWYLLAMCKQRLNQDAEPELLRAVHLRPYLVSAYYRLWQTLQAAGKTEQAAPHLETFKRLRENPLAETIELPQYNQMGDLALVRPVAARRDPPITKSSLAPQPERVLHQMAPSAVKPDALAGSSDAQPGGTSDSSPSLGGIAAGDMNTDGRPDLLVASGGRLVYLQSQADGGFSERASAAGLGDVRQPLACAVGDFDNDGNNDLFVTTVAANHLFRGTGNGTFEDVSAPTGLHASTPGRAAVFLDADHDGDLDVFVCGRGANENQLWNNNADGRFTNISASAGVATAAGATTALLAGDLDGDRDMDLVLLSDERPARLFANELLGKFRELDAAPELHGSRGGALQDFNGDGQLDLIVLGGKPAGLQLAFGDGRGRFHVSAPFADAAKGTASADDVRAFRTADVDLDGDLDIAVFAEDVHLLFNDGAGRFVPQLAVWPRRAGATMTAAELFDLDGDFTPDLVRAETGDRVSVIGNTLTPPSTAVSVTPTGLRGRDKRTRSPASGYGTVLTARAGLREQRVVYTGLAGGPNQSALPQVLGLGGARQADYLQLLWPDGVAQVEIALVAGQAHKVAEVQRKISSCPVLFTWNGTRFEFVTDFAGVGGLGYFVAPGQYAPPQVLEHVRIEPGLLKPKNGRYEMRITEPMEETAYVDRLELLAIDHPADWLVYPDERLALSGAPPTHDLLVVRHPVFPTQAMDPNGRDCTAALAQVDRNYAYEPVLDRRFPGFCAPHTLELDFGSRLADVAPHERLFLFISGFLEYPFSQTGYAAGQANLAWQPIRIERQRDDGTWDAIVPDAGAFGGMARTMTVDLTGLVSGPTCRLRLTSNLEIYYDQIFAARDAGTREVTTHALPMATAELRYTGYAREFSPDGRMPLLFDYDVRDTTAPFHVLRGEYTRYGPVDELLREFDDAYALVGPGDEIAAAFDAATIPEPPGGMKRTFILVSHAYCKDMDLYTATPQTLEPLPFRGMSQYPYPASERFPDTPKHRELRAKYNTRIVE